MSIAQPITVELKESAARTQWDIIVTIMGKQHFLRNSFAQAHKRQADSTFEALNNAASNVFTEVAGKKIRIRTEDEQRGFSLFSIDNNDTASDVIFEHVKSLAKHDVRGLKLV